jgi:hypothetical protein
MRRELVTIMIPQKATQVSFYPSLYCMSVCEVCKNDLNSSYVRVTARDLIGMGCTLYLAILGISIFSSFLPHNHCSPLHISIQQLACLWHCVVKCEY